MRGALVVAALIVLVTLPVQLFSAAVYGPLAVAPSVPRALAGTWPFAFAHVTGLDRLPAVRVTLARGALVRGDTATAAALVAPLGDDPDVRDLRGRIALAGGDTESALHDFLDAGDFAGARATIGVLAAHDPVAALRVIGEFDRRLSAESDAPEDAAEIAWLEGQIAAAAAGADPAHAARDDALALDAYHRALVRAPNEEKYLLNYAFAALRANQAAAARVAYLRAAQVVPDSVDAFVGIAVSAAVLGDCTPARAALATAQRYAAAQHRAADPVADGYREPDRTALARCGT